MLQDGKGGSPSVNTPCSCHYEGRIAANYPDGATFDSSIARGKPSTFAPRQVFTMEMLDCQGVASEL